jgi:hypothetical protein
LEPAAGASIASKTVEVMLLEFALLLFFLYSCICETIYQAGKGQGRTDGGIITTTSTRTISLNLAR